MHERRARFVGEFQVNMTRREPYTQTLELNLH